MGVVVSEVIALASGISASESGVPGFRRRGF